MERGMGGKGEREGWGDHLPYFLPPPTGFCLKYHPAYQSMTYVEEQLMALLLSEAVLLLLETRDHLTLLPQRVGSTQLDHRACVEQQSVRHLRVGGSATQYRLQHSHRQLSVAHLILHTSQHHVSCHTHTEREREKHPCLPDDAPASVSVGTIFRITLWNTSRVCATSH